MTRSIKEVDYVLFVVTPSSVEAVESGQGALSFEMQISNARRLSGKGEFSIIPIFREGNKTPTYLSDHRYLDFRDDEDYETKLFELCEWIEGRIKPTLLGKSVRWNFINGVIEIAEDDPKEIINILKRFKKINVWGWSNENPDDQKTWVADGEKGVIRMIGSDLEYTRVCDSWYPLWNKKYFKWGLEWSNEYGVIVTGRIGHISPQ